jgi:hypothetical protein
MSLEQSENRDIPVELLDYSKSIFDRYANDFDHLDNKALGVMGVVGLLVSFQALSLDNLVFLFRDFTKAQSPYLLCMTVIFLLAHAVSLVISMIFGLRAFQVRDLDYPTAVMELVERFRRVDKKEKAANYLKIDIVKTYSTSINAFDSANAIKSKHLKQSVILLFIAVISLVVFVFLLLIDKSLS